MEKIKVLAITMGIVFAIFFAAVGSLLISDAIIESAQPKTIEVAAAEYLSEENPNDEITNVEVREIVEDEYYDGYKVCVNYDCNGVYDYSQISMNVINDYRYC